MATGSAAAAATAGRRLREWLRQVDEPLLTLAAAAMGGILAADRWTGPGSGAERADSVLSTATVASLWFIAGLLGAAVRGWFRSSARHRRWWAHVVVFCGFAAAHGLQARDPLRERLETAVAPGGVVPAVVRGVVTDAPAGGEFGHFYQFPLRVESLEGGDGPQPEWPGLGAVVYTRLPEAPAPPQYGDRVVLTGLLRRPAPVRNPGEFDFGNFLRRQGYAGEFTVPEGAGLWRVEAKGQGNAVMAAALKARDWIAGVVTRDLEDSPDIAATVRTMVLGTREKTPEEIAEAFRASGTMHVFSVSGLHVALFSAVLWFGLSRTRLHRGGIAGLTLALVFFYVFITGLRPSAWRAALMVGLVMMAPFWNRQPNLLNSLGASALLLLAFETRQLFQAGFTLSFGVLLAIALLEKPCTAAAGWMLGEWNAPDPFLPEELRSRPQQGWYWIRGKLCRSLGVSTASTVGAMPLMIGYFSMVTPAGIVANLVLVVLSLWILVVACLSLLSAAAGAGPLVLLWNNANWALAWACIGTAQFFASLPWGHVRVDPARLWRGERCGVTVLDLENGGGAVRIDSPQGRQWMVDCGGLKHWNRTVRPHLERAPVNRLDGVFLTHADSYHRGALDSLTALFEPRSVWRTEPARARMRREPTAETATAGGNAAEGFPAPAAAVPGVLEAGRWIPLDQAVSLEVLYPPPGLAAAVEDDRAAVLRLHAMGFRVLFMSDAGFLTEKSLLASGKDLRADVLVMGRHGSDFCGLPEFIRAVDPGALVCTHSRFPESGRLPAAWRERVGRMGIVLFDQALTGGVELWLDKRGLEVRGFVDGSRWTREPAAPRPPSGTGSTREPLVR